MVKAFILNNADKDADKVIFLTWGPHLSRQELVDLAKEAGIVELAHIFDVRMERSDLKRFEAFKTIVRVRYEGLAIDRALPIEDIRIGPDGKRESLQFNSGREQSKRTKTYDCLFMVYAKLVVPLGGEGSDDWKQKLRKELSKRFPALKP